jgi:hypothetical protein
MSSHIGRSAAPLTGQSGGLKAFTASFSQVRLNDPMTADLTTCFELDLYAARSALCATRFQVQNSAIRIPKSELRRANFFMDEPYLNKQSQG